jgi:integrase
MCEYYSVFRKKIIDFLDFKESLNFARHSYSSPLKSLDNFAIQQKLTIPNLSKEVVQGLMTFHKKNITPNGQRGKLIVIRGFGQYLRLIGENAYVIDLSELPKHQQYIPYMYSDSQLRQLFTAMDNLPVKTNNSHIITPVLFRMMYCCAMRPGEPINLLREDVDLINKVIHIKDTKRHANRLVNINDDLFNLLRDFDLKMRSRKWFFCTPNNKQLKIYWGSNMLCTSWIHSGLGIRKSTPRQYDFRHNACSRVLQNWLDEGKEIMTMIPYLQAHMGHCHIQDTLYYLHLLPHELLKSKNIDWSRFSNIYGEVKS